MQADTLDLHIYNTHTYYIILQFNHMSEWVAIDPPTALRAVKFNEFYNFLRLLT